MKLAAPTPLDRRWKSSLACAPRPTNTIGSFRTAPCPVAPDALSRCEPLKNFPVRLASAIAIFTTRVKLQLQKWTALAECC